MWPVRWISAIAVSTRTLKVAALTPRAGGTAGSVGRYFIRGIGFLRSVGTGFVLALSEPVPMMVQASLRHKSHSEKRWRPVGTHALVPERFARQETSAMRIASWGWGAREPAGPILGDGRKTAPQPVSDASRTSPDAAGRLVRALA